MSLKVKGKELKGISIPDSETGLPVEGNPEVTFVKDGRIIVMYFDDIFDLMEKSEDVVSTKMSFEIVDKA